MTTPALEAEVAALVARVTRIDPGRLTREAELDALGLDSVAFIEAIFAIEDAYDITLPLAAEGGAGLRRFGDLVDQVAGLVAA